MQAISLWEILEPINLATEDEVVCLTQEKVGKFLFEFDGFVFQYPWMILHASEHQGTSLFVFVLRLRITEASFFPSVAMPDFFVGHEQIVTKAHLGRECGEPLEHIMDCHPEGERGGDELDFALGLWILVDVAQVIESRTLEEVSDRGVGEPDRGVFVSRHNCDLYHTYDILYNINFEIIIDDEVKNDQRRFGMPERDLKSLQRARRVVEANSDIAETERLFEDLNARLLLNYPSQEETNMAFKAGVPLREILRRLYFENGKRAASRFLTLVEEVEARLGIPYLGIEGQQRRIELTRNRPYRYEASRYIFNNVRESLTLRIGEILKSKPGRDEFVRKLEALTRRLTARKLEQIDRAAQTGEVVQEQIVLVGGGPLTSHAATLLSPYYRVLVITDRDSLGGGWLNRCNMYINSSTSQSNIDTAPLPLLKGSTTTPITPRRHINAIDLGIYDDSDTLKVLCADRAVRKYISGPQLGAAVATNILLSASDVIVGQTVLPAETIVKGDGTKRLTIVDQDGKQRFIDASAVIFLTGPGAEVCKVQDVDSQLLYLESATRLRLLIDLTQRKYRELTQKNAAKNDLIMLVRNFERSLPRLLSQTGIEAVYQMWRVDFDSDPELFPLRDFYTNPAYDLAFIGGGDTTKVQKMAQDGRGPIDAYPPGLIVTPNQICTLYNFPASTTEEYAQASRPLYRQVFDPIVETTTDTEPAKVGAWRRVVKRNGQEVYEVQLIGEDGKPTGKVASHTHLIVATGLDPTPLVEEFNSTPITFRPLFDRDGVGVGLYSRQNLLIAGSAQRQQTFELPIEIQRILSELATENTVALWVYSLLLERALWTLLGEWLAPTNTSSTRRIFSTNLQLAANATLFSGD